MALATGQQHGVLAMMSRWWAAGVVFGAALAVYLASAAPGLTWAHDSADGGELIAAVAVRGVPHPPGYPTYVLLAQPFAALPWGNLAQRGTLFSATAAAAAAGLVAASLRQAPPTCWPGRSAPESADATPAASLPALAAGLALAFSPPLWSQATVVEVYALHAGLAAALLWTLSRWRLNPRPSWLALSGLLLGLSLGNHLTALALLPLVAAWIADGALAQGRHRWLPWVGGLALGLTVYLYLPWAAAGRPPVNWGDPRTWEGFRWLVTAELYRPNAFGLPADQVPVRLAAAAAALWRGLLPWGVALALAGLAELVQTQLRLVVAAGLSLCLGLAWALGYNTPDSQWSLLAGWTVVSWWAGIGLLRVWRWTTAQGRAGAVAGVGLCALVAAAPLLLHGPAQSLRHDREAEQFIAHVLRSAEPDAVVLAVGDRALFGLWYARYGQGRRPDLIPLSRDLWGLSSYRAVVGYTHPDLAGEAPPADWSALIRQTAGQRPLYLASASPEAYDVEALDLPAHYRLEPIPDPDRPDAAIGLWRLRP